MTQKNNRLANAVMAGGTATLKSAGTIAESGSGYISAATLAGSSRSTTTLNGANQIASLAAFTNTGGNFALTDDQGLTITATLNAGTRGVTLVDTGTLTESTGVIDAATLTGSSVGGTTLNGANLIGTLDAFTNAGSGGFALTDGKTLTVSGVLNAGTGDVALTTTGAGHNLSIANAITAGGTATLKSIGTIAESGSGSISAATLAGSSRSTTTLNGANQIASLGTFTNTGGNFALTDDQGLTITGTLNAGAHGVSLVDTGTLTESSGAIDAATLTGSSVGGTTLNGANLIGTLDAFTNTGSGGFALTDGKTLTVNGAVNAGTGILALATTNLGNIAIDSAVSGGTINLTSAGDVTESAAGALTTGLLNVMANSGIDLASSLNNIAIIGVNHTNSGPDVINQN